ncbi:hypothetical protein ACJMK2_026165 [Sinanodonta woodiana]|uniref:CARD domain-containing protein n=1 Tax=Sinanodonta woodiana TaxID=1069815 RepID=A0ABD3XIQ9_SINWO
MDTSTHVNLLAQKKEQRTYYQQNYIFLKEQLEPLNKIVDEIISRGCRDNLFSEKIREAKSRELRADILLKYAVDHLSRQIFESILRVSDYGHLIDDLRKGTALKSSISKDEDEIHLLSKYSFKEFLRQELEPKDLIDRLLEHGILSFQDHDDILTTSFRRQRVDNLFRYLEYRSKEDHQLFFVILKKKYPLILDEFKESQSASCQECCLYTDVRRTDGGWRLSQPSIIDEDTEIKFHLKLSPASPSTEMKIVEESAETNMEVEYHQKCLDLQMKSLHLGSVVIICKQLSRQSIQKLREACHNNKINEFIKSLFTAQDMEKMKQDNVNGIVLTITTEKHDMEKKIPVITKEAIVKNFSFIEKEIIDAEVFFAGFLKCGLLTSENEKTLQMLKCKSREERNIEFLSLILRGQTGLLQIFQHELARLGYEKILKRICFDNVVLTHDKITDKELKDNESYLLSELEPKEFLPALGKILPEEGQNKIVCTVSRRERAKLFLDEVIKRGQPAVDIFVSELERLDRHFVIKILTKITVNDELAASEIRVHILDNYTTLIDELEPKIFHKFFLEKGVMKEETFKKIVKFPTRRNRAVAFLKWVLGEGSTKALIAFQMAVKLFCDDAVVKMFEAPTPSMQSGPSFPVVDKTSKAVELYKATFKVTFHYVSNPKIGSEQAQESSTNKEGEEGCDGQSLKKEVCTPYSAQNPDMDEENSMSIWVDSLLNEGLNSSLTAGSMQKTKSKCLSLVSSQSSKSRKVNDQNKDFIPNKSISLDEKVTGWLLQNVTEDSNSWVPLPNDLASVQVKPLSDGTCASHGYIRKSTKAGSGVFSCDIQDGTSDKSCGYTARHKQSTLNLRKDHDTSMTVPASTYNANVNVEDNFSISDQGYISHQDNNDFDQATVSSFTSGRFCERNLSMAESILSMIESEPYPFDSLHTKSQTPLKKSKASIRPCHKINSFRTSSPISLSASGTCSPNICSSMGLNVSRLLPCCTYKGNEPSYPVGSYFRQYGASSFHNFLYGLTGSVPSPRSHFEPTESSPSASSCCSPVGLSSPANSLITTQNFHRVSIGSTKVNWIDNYNERQSQEGVLTQTGSLESYDLSGPEQIILNDCITSLLYQQNTVHHSQ